MFSSNPVLMQANYHSHTRWCRHGSGEIEEYIKEAIYHGFEEYGITEHIPFKGFKSGRIYYEELDDFMKELDFYKEKYKGEIKILKGLECEYFESMHDYYNELKDKYSLDYLVLGQHFKSIDYSEKYTTLEKDFFYVSSSADIKDYEKVLIKGMESDLFKFVAHPDVFLNDYSFDNQAKETAKRIFEVASKNNIALEINAKGVRANMGYPNWDFWELSKDYDLTRIINSDCHSPSGVYDRAIERTYEKAFENNIKITPKLEF